MTRIIKQQFFFSHPPETVWEYLTTPGLIAQWLMKNNFQPVVGHDFQFTTNPLPALDFDGVIYCKVLEIVPFKTLSYSWNSGPGEGRITLESRVVWTLQSAGTGTDLFLEHSGFGKEHNLDFFKGLTDGWPKKMLKIVNLLNAAPHDTTRA